MRWTAVLFTIAALTRFAPHAPAQSGSCVFVEQKFLGSSTGPWQEYGRGVATDGLRLAAGAPGTPGTGVAPKGSIDVYEPQGGQWVLEDTLQAVSPPPLSSMAIGREVRIDGDTVGTSDGGFGLSGVYVFERGPSGWVEAAVVVPPDGAFGSGMLFRGFGSSFDLQGDLLLVGAPSDNDLGFASGAAYMFRRTSGIWSLEKKIFPSDPASGIGFGGSVALDGDRAVVGAKDQHSGGGVQGAAYVFLRDSGNWTEEARLDPPGQALVGELGTAVDIRGDRIAAGSVLVGTPNRRAVVVYSRASGTWLEESVVETADPLDTGLFGWSLALASDGLLLVGADQAETTLPAGGAAYVFQREGSQWTEIAKLFDPDGNDFSDYAVSVAAEDERLVVGASRTFVLNVAVGAVHTYRADLGPEVYCTAKVNSLGCTPSIGWTGSASFGGPSDLRVTAQDVLAGQNGILIWSRTSATTPFGGGTLCLGSPVQRTPVQNSGSSGAGTCAGSYSFQFTTAYFISQLLAAGDELHAQYWSRDTGFAPPDSIGLTDALHVSICP